MKSHKHMYDINRILSLANSSGESAVENYALQLDYLLSTEEVSEKFVDNTVEFLYSLLETR